MIKDYLVKLIISALETFMESGQLAEWLEKLQAFVADWLELKLRELARKSDNKLDDELVDIILDSLRCKPPTK